jgi:hypothetical protein
LLWPRSLFASIDVKAVTITHLDLQVRLDLGLILEVDALLLLEVVLALLAEADLARGLLVKVLDPLQAIVCLPICHRQPVLNHEVHMVLLARTSCSINTSLKFIDFLFVNLDLISVLEGRVKVISRVVKGCGKLLLIELYLQVESAWHDLRGHER